MPRRRLFPITACEARGSRVHIKQALPEIQPDRGDLLRPAAQVKLDNP